MNQEKIQFPTTAPTRKNDPITSKVSALSFNYSERITDVFLAIERLRCCTSFECADYLKLPVQNISNCFIRLIRLGVVEIAGVQMSLETGRPRQIYKLTPLGQFKAQSIKKGGE